MHDAYTPLVFYRHSHRLRALMVDNQPWFVAHDFARLIGAADALPLLQALEPHEQQTLRLGYTHDFHEEAVAISDIGAYKALFQFGGPAHGEVGRWLSEVLVPTLHDYHRVPDAAPCRDVMSFEGRRIGVVRWQGEVWVAWRDLPAFMTSGNELPLANEFAPTGVGEIGAGFFREQSSLLRGVQRAGQGGNVLPLAIEIAPTGVG